MRERHKAVAHNLRTLNHVDECVRVDVAQAHFELNQIGTVEVGVNHLTLLAFEQACADKACTTSIQIFDDVFSHIFNLISDDKCRLVALDTVDDEVDDLAFNHNQKD